MGNLKDKDDNSTEGSENESDPETKPSMSTRKSKCGSKKAALKKNCRNLVTRRGGRAEDEGPRVVLDKGTQFEVIGGKRWHEFDRPSKIENIGGLSAGMDGPTLSIVNAVYTCVTLLLGLSAISLGETIGMNRPSR